MRKEKEENEKEKKEEEKAEEKQHVIITVKANNILSTVLFF